MKIGSLIMFSLLSSCSVFAQDPVEALPEAKSTMTPAEADELLKKLSQSFENLSEEDRVKYLKMRNEAAQLFQNKRVFETLDLVRKMSEIFESDPQLLVLKGACYVEIRDFQSASEAFNQAVKIVGPRYNILFNLAEIDFVTGKWEKALEKLENVENQIPNRDANMKRLVDFKIMLCHIRLAENAKDEASKAKHESAISSLVKKQDHMDDSPFYYYANAAYNYYKKNDQEADQWLGRGRRVYQYSPGLISSWEDTLIEFGYIKSYFGNDDATTENKE